VTEPLLDVRDLSVSIGSGPETVAAVTAASLRVAHGEVVGLVGESGAGKTMLARAVTGLLPPNARATGQVLFAGEDVLRMSEDALERHRGAGAALCFQNPRRALSPFRRVGGQIDDRLAAHAQHVREPPQPVELLASVGIRDPQRRARAYAHELSGGMAQRVMISLALACYPRLLVADEPTTGLDVTLTRSILSLLRRAASDDERGVLIISHDVAAIAEVCDRIVVMNRGETIEEGPTAAIVERPEHPYTVALLDAVPDISAPPEPARTAARVPTAASNGAGRDAGGRRDLTGPVLAVEDVEVVHGARFGRGGHRALRGVTLSIAAGETVAVVGESGSGKTTLARASLGLVRPTAGTIRFEGRDLATMRRRELRRLRSRMQMVFQDPVDSVDPRRTVRKTLRDSLRLIELDGTESARRIDEALAQVGLDPAIGARYRHEISGGQAQRVGIARALLPDPDLIVFDEPTSALDVTVQAQVLELIERLMRERDRAYLYVSHDLATVRAVADRVVVLYLGTVVEDGPADRVFERPLHPYTRALLAGVPTLRGERRAETVELARDLEDAGAGVGCVLAPRCPFVKGERCTLEPQALIPYEPGQRAACWRVPEIT
jgi:peptide/nickel transport system ATP-binding protein